MTVNRRFLIIGAGLIGTSLALAVRQSIPGAVMDAVELNETYREQVQALYPEVFRHVYADCGTVSSVYDVAVLAIPPNAASELLEWATMHATIVMDVCSIKRGICEHAERLGLRMGEQFVPSHPMAGKASGGPRDADATIFAGRPWIFLQNARPGPPMLELIRQIGAQPLFLDDASAHDEVVASVSHGIHVTSLAAMLTSDVLGQCKEEMAPFAGPALWDITRLAASPVAFWRDTLLENKVNVVRYLRGLQEQLSLFEGVIEAGHADALESLLRQAQQARSRWDERRKS